jgi:hypothetical protein
MQDTVTIDKLKGVDDTSLVDWSMPRDKITEQLKRDGRLTIIENGCPIAVMLDVNSSNLEDTLADVRRIRAQRIMKSAQMSAFENGTSNMTLDEINAEITAMRAKRKVREKSK